MDLTADRSVILFLRKGPPNVRVMRITRAALGYQLLRLCARRYTLLCKKWPQASVIILAQKSVIFKWQAYGRGF